MSDIVEKINKLVGGEGKIGTDFENAFDKFFQGCRKICADYAKKEGKGKPNPENAFAKQLIVKKNKKYWKVIATSYMGSSKSAWVFVDSTNGNVLKVASWSKPAKGPRGNVFDKQNGLGMITPYGAKSFR